MNQTPLDQTPMDETPMDQTFRQSSNRHANNSKCQANSLPQPGVPSLEPIREVDLANMLQWAKSPTEVFQWSGGSLQYPLDIDQLKRYALDPAAKRRAFQYQDETGHMAGYIELSNIDHDNDTCSLTRVIVDPGRRSAGVGQRMVASALEEGFVRLGLNRITLHVFTDNTSAVRCYAKAGFVKEGHLRQVYKHDGQYWDVYLMSVLRAFHLRNP